MVVLKEGDSLLLEASDTFLKEFGSLDKVNDFASVTQVSGKAQTNSVVQRSRPGQALVALFFVLFIAIGSAAKLIELPLAALVASFGLLFCRTISRYSCRWWCCWVWVWVWVWLLWVWVLRVWLLRRLFIQHPACLNIL
jgi:hypothetical protein